MVRLTPYYGEVIPAKEGFTYYTGPVIPPMPEKSVAHLQDIGDITPSVTPAPAISAAVGTDVTPTDLTQALKPVKAVAQAGVSVTQALSQFPASGFAGIGGYYGNLLETGDFDSALKAGTEEMEEYLKKNVYQPDTPEVQHAMEVLTLPLQYWMKGAEAAGDFARETTGSSTVGAVTEVLTFMLAPEMARKK